MTHKKIKHPYYIEEDRVLYKKVTSIDKQVDVLSAQVHHALGHASTLRTYHFVKCLYYWKGLHKDVNNYIHQCMIFRQECEATEVCPSTLRSAADAYVVYYYGSDRQSTMHLSRQLLCFYSFLASYCLCVVPHNFYHASGCNYSSLYKECIHLVRSFCESLI